MKFIKNPFVAIILCVLIVLSSSVISISVKLNNKCEAITDSFYEGKIQHGVIITSIYADLVEMYELAGDVILVADNYGIKTKALSDAVQELKDELNFKNDDFSDIFEAYSSFSMELRAVEIALSDTDLSQRHIEFMNSTSQRIYQLKTSIESSNFNESVRTFYKKFDRFPVNFFADIFEIEYPEYFA